MSSRTALPFNPAVHHARELPGHGASRVVAKPAAAYRQRFNGGREETPFNAPEVWHEPHGKGALRVAIQPAGVDYLHPVTEAEVRERLAKLPVRYTRDLEVVQLSRMTRKRRTFPCYGMQWGQSVYLYPIEKNLVELYSVPPKPAQQIEARMFGATWAQEQGYWTLTWTEESIKDFYLNNVLIHEVGHLNDPRNTTYRERERFANWFAIEYGYRAARGRRG
ncbi:MAG: hypothetical protein V4719_15825 [Planctomycetota bacterium]